LEVSVASTLYFRRYKIN